MATVLLVRHGRTTANSAGVLAGWTDGVSLDEAGQEQVRALAGRLSKIPLTALVCSPLLRCQETADLLLQGRDGAEVPRHDDERIGEVRYGDWSGQELKKLAKDPLWKVVQGHPSAMTFPGDGGESMTGMANRAVTAVREWNARLGQDAVYVVVSHGDVIKAILADALGMHLDQFQRIVVDPASISVVTYTPLRPFVVRANDMGGDLAFLAPKKAPKKGPKKGSGRSRAKTRKATSSDADIGGGSGTSTPAVST